MKKGEKVIHTSHGFADCQDQCIQVEIIEIGSDEGSFIEEESELEDSDERGEGVLDLNQMDKLIDQHREAKHTSM